MADILNNKKITLKGESNALLKYPYNLKLSFKDGTITGTYGAFDDKTCKIEGSYDNGGEVSINTKTVFPMFGDYEISGVINENGNLKFKAKTKNPFFSNYSIDGCVNETRIELKITPRSIFSRKHYIFGKREGDNLRLDDFDGPLLNRTTSLDYKITGTIKDI